MSQIESATFGLALFECTRLNARLTQKACAERWRRAHSGGRLGERYVSCKGCDVGKAHAGGVMPPQRSVEVLSEFSYVNHRNRQIRAWNVRCDCGYEWVVERRLPRMCRKCGEKQAKKHDFSRPVPSKRRREW